MAASPRKYVHVYETNIDGSLYVKTQNMNFTVVVTNLAVFALWLKVRCRTLSYYFYGLCGSLGHMTLVHLRPRMEALGQKNRLFGASDESCYEKGRNSETKRAIYDTGV